MTITINFMQKPSPGYTPRKPLQLHNVASVEDNGVDMILVHMTFADHKPTYDHVASVSVIPERAE